MICEMCSATSWCGLHVDGLATSHWFELASERRRCGLQQRARLGSTVCQRLSVAVHGRMRISLWTARNAQSAEAASWPASRCRCIL